MSDEPQNPSRRRFTRTSLGVTVGALVAGAAVITAAGSKKKRYAIVGVGSRSYMYQDAIHNRFHEQAELVACVDTNPGRIKLAQAFAKSASRPEPRAYAAGDFERMIGETKPEVVIVTTVDGTHHDYISRAMLNGADVLTEKPMTTDSEKCRLILETKKKTGRRCQVAFNYRYTPVRSQIKELLMSGLVGDVQSVDFHWMLDTHHGADYFRRWHSQKAHSGGLMVHKATHHFDLINWWLSAIPVRVVAFGKREFYTPKMARRLGLNSHHERCHTCEEKQKCSFELSLAGDPNLKSLYLDQEQHDGYVRDRCVWRPEIDIEDTMNVQVRYDSGATLSYSLNAFMPWEGYTIAFNGTRGRLEHKMEEAIVIDPNRPSAVKAEGTYLRMFPLRESAYEIPVRTGEGSHYGGDPLMLDDLFGPAREDPLQRAADERSGAYSILTGVAANRSMLSGAPINVADLVPDLAYPSYTKMPANGESLPMPRKG